MLSSPEGGVGALTIPSLAPQPHRVSWALGSPGSAGGWGQGFSPAGLVPPFPQGVAGPAPRGAGSSRRVCCKGAAAHLGLRETNEFTLGANASTFLSRQAVLPGSKQSRGTAAGLTQGRARAGVCRARCSGPAARSPTGPRPLPRSQQRPTARPGRFRGDPAPPGRWRHAPLTVVWACAGLPSARAPRKPVSWLSESPSAAPGPINRLRTASEEGPSRAPRGPGRSLLPGRPRLHPAAGPWGMRPCTQGCSRGPGSVGPGAEQRAEDGLWAGSTALTGGQRGPERAGAEGAWKDPAAVRPEAAGGRGGGGRGR